MPNAATPPLPPLVEVLEWSPAGDGSRYDVCAKLYLEGDDSAPPLASTSLPDDFPVMDPAARGPVFAALRLDAWRMWEVAHAPVLDPAEA